MDCTHGLHAWTACWPPGARTDCTHGLHAWTAHMDCMLATGSTHVCELCPCTYFCLCALTCVFTCVVLCVFVCKRFHFFGVWDLPTKNICRLVPACFSLKFYMAFVHVYEVGIACGRHLPPCACLPFVLAARLQGASRCVSVQFSPIQPNR